MNFKPKSVHNWNDESKKIILLGEIDGKDAILIQEKQIFNKQLPDEIILKDAYFSNDIFHKYEIPILDKQDYELIYPADEKQINKYKRSEIQVVIEKPQDYAPLTAEVKWVINILEGKSEIENVLYRNEEFIVVRDYKSVAYDIQLDKLHLLVLTIDPSIRSLRDLNDKHLNLLYSMQNIAYSIAEKEFKVKKNQIRAFIHYKPTFYHFHIHFKHVMTPGDPYRDHILENVIQNIELKKDYYQTMNVPFLDKL